MPESSFDALNKAGLQRLPEAQRVIFEELSPDELRVVSAIQERLNAAAPEIEAQAADNNNCLC